MMCRIKNNLFVLLAFFFIGIFSFTNFAYADNVGLEWVKGINTGNSAYVLLNGSVEDSNGYKYFLVNFTGTTDFGFGGDTVNLTSYGSTGTALLKFDSSGNLVWVKQTGFGSGHYYDRGGIAIDGSDNLYITSIFDSTADFDPGAGTTELTSAGGDDIAINKLDQDGNLLWVKQIGSTLNDVGDGITVGTDGIYVNGFYRGTVDFDPGVGVSNLPIFGSEDAFVAKYDFSGNFVWAKGMGTTGWGDWPIDVLLDSSENVYTIGAVRFNNFNAGDAGSGDVILTNTGTYQPFITKHDSSGNLIWAKIINVASVAGFADSAMIDSSDNFYFLGHFQGVADLDPGAGTAELTSIGSEDIFLLKLDSSGDFVWVKQFGSTGSDEGYGLDADSSRNIYLSGKFSNTVDFDLSSGTSELTSAGDSDAFILKLDPVGDFVWVKQFGGTGFDRTNSTLIDSSNNIYLSGHFTGTADFDPGAGTTELTSAGSYDTFILKLTPIITPTLTTSSASNITGSNATLNASITNTGYDANTTRGFQYGLTTSYGSTITETGTFSAGSYQTTLTELNCSNTYHYRAYSLNSEATGYGSDSTFTTPGCAAVPVYILQAMSDAIRAQENNTVVLPPTTNTTNTNTQTTNTNNTVTNTKFIFTKNLKYKMKDNQVLELQKFLNNNGYPVSTSGIGSLGNETNYFGLATRSALIKYQKANDIKPAVGYFGPITRALVNELAK